MNNKLEKFDYAVKHFEACKQSSGYFYVYKNGKLFTTTHFETRILAEGYCCRLIVQDLDKILFYKPPDSMGS